MQYHSQQGWTANVQPPPPQDNVPIGLLVFLLALVIAICCYGLHNVQVQNSALAAQNAVLLDEVQNSCTIPVSVD